LIVAGKQRRELSFDLPSYFTNRYRHRKRWERRNGKEFRESRVEGRAEKSIVIPIAISPQ